MVGILTLHKGHPSSRYKVSNLFSVCKGPLYSVAIHIEAMELVSVLELVQKQTLCIS